jgi:hypothetical protein
MINNINNIETIKKIETSENTNTNIEQKEIIIENKLLSFEYLFSNVKFVLGIAFMILCLLSMINLTIFSKQTIVSFSIASFLFSLSTFFSAIVKFYNNINSNKKKKKVLKNFEIVFNLLAILFTFITPFLVLPYLNNTIYDKINIFCTLSSLSLIYFSWGIGDMIFTFKSMFRIDE